MSRWRVIVYTNASMRLVPLPYGLRWETERHDFGPAVSCRPASRETADEIAKLCSNAGLHGRIKKIPEPTPTPVRKSAGEHHRFPRLARQAPYNQGPPQKKVTPPGGRRNAPSAAVGRAKAQSLAP